MVLHGGRGAGQWVAEIEAVTICGPTMDSDLKTSYDNVAREYAENLYGELAGKPFDREILDRFAARVGNGEPVCDLGCGPGQIARYLRDRGVEVAIRKSRGMDIAAACGQLRVERLGRRSPRAADQHGDVQVA